MKDSKFTINLIGPKLSIVYHYIKNPDSMTEQIESGYNAAKDKNNIIFKVRNGSVFTGKCYKVTFSCINQCVSVEPSGALAYLRTSICEFLGERMSSRRADNTRAEIQKMTKSQINLLVRSRQCCFV